MAAVSTNYCDENSYVDITICDSIGFKVEIKTFYLLVFSGIKLKYFAMRYRLRQ